MVCMGHGRKKYSKFVTKIPIFSYNTLVHLDSTSNHSKSCRGLFFVHSVEFWGQTDIICRSWKHNSKMMIIIDLSSPIKMARSIRLVWKFVSILRLDAFLGKIPEFCVYDDACRLRRFLEKRINSRKYRPNRLENIRPGKIKYVVDRLHIKGHTEAWCLENCDSKLYPELKGVNTEASMRANWFFRFRI